MEHQLAFCLPEHRGGGVTEELRGSKIRMCKKKKKKTERKKERKIKKGFPHLCRNQLNKKKKS